ncbi:MAG: hypothetical protein JXR78_16645, partial [Victivallales bacterium]|nr:hypothetical protein [Victivallales bacterium]
GVHATVIGFYLLPLLWLPITPKRPSDMTIWLLYMFSYAPTTFICFHIIKDPFPDAIFLLVALLIALIIVDLSRRHRIKLIFHLDLPIIIPLDKIIIMLSVLLCIYVVYLMKFNFNFDFVNVYERRLAIRGSSSLLTGYILSFCRSVIIIFSVYLAFVKKSRIAFLALIILSVGIFAYDGTKSSLLIPMFLVLIYFLTIFKKSNVTINFILLFFIIVSIVEFIRLDSNITSTLFTRRIFAVPGLLNTLFWEYYSVHDKVMMADSIGRYFLGSTNVTASTFVIGYEFFDSLEANANTGIWMGSYAHFGFIGIVLLSMVSGFILGLVDNLTKTKFPVLGYLVCAYIGILWSEQMLHTSMLTGGIFYILIFLMIYCNPNILNRKKHYHRKAPLAFRKISSEVG